MMQLARKKDIDFSLLDQLRGLAALGVVIGHARGVLFVGGARLSKLIPQAEWSLLDKAALSLLSLTRLGPEYVVLFFVLSGFSIAYSLNERPVLKEFYLRRLVRLYPTYLGALLWAIAVFLITLNWRPDFYSGVYDHVSFDRLAESRNFLDFRVVVGNLLYMPTGILIGPFWSLTFEVIFYALAPLFIVNRRAYYFMSLAAYGLGFVSFGWDSGKENIIRDFIFSYNIYFMIGIAAFYNWKRLRGMLNLRTFPLSIIIASIFLASVVLDYKLGGIGRLSSMLFAVGAVLLMVNVHTHDWRSPILISIGNMSYTLYVTHFASMILLLAIVHQFVPPPYILSKTLWMLGVPFAFGPAFVFYRLIEKRSKEALKILRKSRPAAAPLVNAEESRCEARGSAS